MIDDNKRAEILRLFHAEAWTVGMIASELGVHHAVQNEGAKVNVAQSRNAGTVSQPSATRGQTALRAGEFALSATRRSAGSS